MFKLSLTGNVETYGITASRKCPSGNALNDEKRTNPGELKQFDTT